MGWPQKATSAEKEKRDLMAKTINTLIMTGYNQQDRIGENDLKTIALYAGNLVDAIFTKYPDMPVPQSNYSSYSKTAYPPTNSNFLDIKK